MFEKVIARVKEQWQAISEKLSTAQKTGLVVALLVVVSGMITLLLWTTQLDHRIIFSNLEPESMAEVIERLKELNVPYELSHGGRSLAVPSEMADEMRVVLGPSIGSLPEPTEDDSWVGKTPDEIRSLRLRKLERSLAKTINRLDAVASCQVHLTESRPSVFTTREVPPSASVTVTSRRHRPLTDQEGYLVASIVAGAMTGLGPERVIVVDTRGRRIWPDGDTGVGGLRKQARQWESELSVQLTHELEMVVGTGKAHVNVHIELDSSEIETVRRRLDTEGVPSREVVVMEQRSGVGGGPGGQAGAVNVAAGNPGMVTVGSAGGTSTRKQTTINYELGRETRTIHQARGALRSIAISAWVSGNHREVGEGDLAKLEYVPVSEEKMKEMRKLLSVYVREERGDRLELVDLPAAPVEVYEEPGVAASTVAWIVRLLPYMVALIIALLLAFFGLRPVVSFLTAKQVEAKVLPPEGARALMEGELKLDALEVGALSLQEFLREFARQDPERMAMVLEHWLRQAV